MNSVTSLSTLSLQGIMACRITSRVALQRTYRDKCHFYRLCGSLLYVGNESQPFREQKRLAVNELSAFPPSIVRLASAVTI